MQYLGRSNHQNFEPQLVRKHQNFDNLTRVESMKRFRMHDLQLLSQWRHLYDIHIAYVIIYKDIFIWYVVIILSNLNWLLLNHK